MKSKFRVSFDVEIEFDENEMTEQEAILKITDSMHFPCEDTDDVTIIEQSITERPYGPEEFQIPPGCGKDNYFGESADFGQTGYWMVFRKDDKRFRVERIDEPTDCEPLKSDEVAWALARLAGYELDDDGYVLKSPKEFQVNAQIGRTRYSVSFHDGVKRHNDGSRFFDLRTFKTKMAMNDFVSDLTKQGYRMG